MALANIYRVVQDLEGNVVTGVLGTVTLSGTATLAFLFSDAAGTIPLPNPTTNNAQYGSFSLFLAAGTYDMQFVKAGFTFQTQTNITLRDPDAGVNTITGTANRVIVAPVPGVGAVTLSTPQDIAPDSTLQFAHLGLGTPGNASYGLDVSTASRFTGTLNASAVAITGGSVSVERLGVNTPAPATAGYVQMNGPVGIGVAPDPAYSIKTAFQTYFQNTMGVQRVPASNVALWLNHSKGSQYGLAITATDTDTGQAAILLSNVAGAAVGSITTTAAATAYNTTSDARLKHAIAPLTGALGVVQALRPVRFRWNVDESEGVGFLAQEVAAHVAGVITGEPDAIDGEGRILPQQIDYSKLVPWLVGAIQTLVQRLEVVEDAVGV